MSQAASREHFNNEQTRATSWNFIKGAATGEHTHELDYVVVPITGGDFRVELPNGDVRTMHQEPGVPYVGTRGTTHNVINTSEHEAAFVEVELKDHRPTA